MRRPLQQQTYHISERTNSHQIPDKTSKDHQEKSKFERYSGPFGHPTCANRHYLVKKGPCDSCYRKHITLVGTRQQALSLNSFFNGHPSLAFKHCASIRIYGIRYGGDGGGVSVQVQLQDMYRTYNVHAPKRPQNTLVMWTESFGSGWGEVGWGVRLLYICRHDHDDA